MTRQAIAGELDSWSAEPSRALALVLLLDQFPRQIWRDSAMAFAGDPQALALSLRAVELGRLMPLFDQFTDSRTVSWWRPGQLHQASPTLQLPADAHRLKTHRSPPGCPRRWPSATGDGRVRPDRHG
jgi:hypothetical protein